MDGDVEVRYYIIMYKFTMLVTLYVQFRNNFIFLTFFRTALGKIDMDSKECHRKQFMVGR